LSEAATSGIVTGIHAIVKNKPDAGVLVSASAINSGVTAGLFFSALNFSCAFAQNVLISPDLHLAWRELFISPFLLRVVPGQHYAHRRQEVGDAPQEGDEIFASQAMSWSELRSYKLLDSGLSGMITGGVLRGMRCEFLVHSQYSSSLTHDP